MTAVLLPINPKHVENIFLGKKKYEFRKVKCLRKVDRIYIYSTHPVMRVVGYAEVLNVLIDKPEVIWEISKKQSGIDKDFFDDYYKGKDYAVAFELGNVIKYKKAKKLSDMGIKYIPQSLVYLDD